MEINNIIEWTSLSENVRSLKDRCGIYIIRNKVNLKFYIGSSKYLYTRITEHRCRFRKNEGINPHIQKAYNKYGEDAFEYSILEFCTEDIKYERELYYLTLLKPEYNITLQVLANKGLPKDEITKQRSSLTLREMVKNGEIYSRITYIYNIETYTLCAICNSAKDARKLLKVTTSLSEFSVYKKKYIIHYTKFENLCDLVNYVTKLTKLHKQTKRYIVSKNLDGNITYYDSSVQCAKINNFPVARIYSNINISENDPLIINNVLIYFMNTYIPLDVPTENIEYVPEFEGVQIKRGKV